MEINTEYDTSVDTLSKYGATFQTKALAALLGSHTFVAQSFDVINPNYFENEAAKWIVKFLLKYYGEYKTLPSMEVFATELQKTKDDNLIYIPVRDLLRDVYVRAENKIDSDYVQKEFLEFCKNQTLKGAILRSVDLLQSGRYPEIKTVIDKAMHAGTARDLGHDYSDIDSRLKTPPRDVIPTGWGPIDALMNGGLAGGELGVIIAPSGIGKSWILATISAHAMRLGLSVIYYTLELNEHYVGVRHDTIFTGIEPALMQHHYDEVKDVVGKLSGKIKIKYFPARGATVHSLQAHIEQLRMVGFIPDIIVVDYADLMRSTDKHDNTYAEQGAVYQELRGMAGEMKIPIWTASQSQRSAIEEEIIQADKIAESYQKVMVSDFVMSASRTLEHKAKNEGRIHVIKNRFGMDGVTYKMYMHTGMGLVKVVEPNSAEDLALKQRLTNMASTPSVVTATSSPHSDFLKSVYKK